MVKFVAFADQLAAQALAAKVDAALGYPETLETTDARHIGRGRHAPLSAGLTLTHAKPMRDAVDAWVYPVSDRVREIRSREVRDVLDAKTEIDAEARLD